MWDFHSFFISGWWFGTMEFHDFSWRRGNVIIPYNPIWRTPSFFRGVGWNHQPDIVWWDSSETMGIFERISLTTSMVGSWLARGLHSPIWWIDVNCQDEPWGNPERNQAVFLLGRQRYWTTNSDEIWPNFRWGLESLPAFFWVAGLTVPDQEHVIGFHLPLASKDFLHLSIPGWIM